MSMELWIQFCVWTGTFLLAGCGVLAFARLVIQFVKESTEEG